MSAEELVTLQIADGVAEVRLVHGDGGNAIGPAWVTAFAAALTQVEQAPGVRAVLLCAEGRAFTVGGDIGHFGQQRHRMGDELQELVSAFNATVLRVGELTVPVVCAVQGPIAGGGLGLAWCSDIVLAAPGAKFATGFHRLGLSGDGGSSWFLPRLVGLRRAQEMLIRGRVLDAALALQWGLVTEVVDADQLDSRAREVAAELAAGPTVALARMRGLLRDTWDVTLPEHLSREVRNMTETGSTADAVEGVTAFLERRAPVFSGR